MRGGRLWAAQYIWRSGGLSSSAWSALRHRGSSEDVEQADAQDAAGDATDGPRNHGWMHQRDDDGGDGQSCCEKDRDHGVDAIESSLHKSVADVIGVALPWRQTPI